VLSIAVSGPASGQCGTNLVFTLSVTNNSSSVAAGNVIAQYILPSSCDYVGSSDGGAYAGGIVTWNLGSLAPAGTRQVTVTISCCRAPGGSELISTGAVVWQYPAGTMHGPAFGNARTHIQAPPAPAPPQAPEAVAPPAHQGVTSHSSTVSDTHSWTWDNNAVNLSNIVVQSASLSSSKAEPGASVTVSAVVANKGTVNGSTRITVYVNGEKDQSYGVSVNSGKSTRLQFAISREMPGTYSVYVNGVSAGSFSVSDNLGNNIVLMLSSLCLLTALFLGILMTLRRRQNPY
ncbi:MAG: CARDB domain-containing protein, partial [Dehalococcoidia bacterium]